jgi:murein L,D-transpeptidase YcbB/YkuD
MKKAPLALAVAAMAIGSLAGTSLAFAAAPKSSNIGLDASPEPSSAPDPLTPPDKSGPAPAAPGTPAPAAAADQPAEADAIVLAARQLIDKEPARGMASADAAGLAAYYDTTSRPIWVDKDGFTARAKQAIGEIGKADDWGLKAEAFELPSAPPAEASPEVLAAAEVKLSRAVLKYARHARGGRVDPESISRLLDRKPVIFDPKSLLEATAATEKVDAYLRGLHPQHPQFELLRQALVKARASGHRDNVSRLLANLERWRWMPADLGSFYVWDSIPDQMTRVYDKGEVVLAEKIVVGKPTTPTPIFSADMQFVIFHPEWGVPNGIKTNELAPRLRQSSGGMWLFGGSNASAVLRANNLRVTYNGRAIDPDSINWANVDIRNYSFVQSAGPSNVLGMVKFRFPNKHDVYMHDTPERNLFGGSTRAFSHGCMRVQNPMRLAEVLLAHDKGWSKGEVQEAERRGADVTLTTTIPVHVTYFTAVAEPNGDVRYLPDIYGLDGRVASAIEGAPVRLMTATVDEDAPPAAPATKASRRTSRTPAKQPEWNPFADLLGN